MFKLFDFKIVNKEDYEILETEWEEQNKIIDKITAQFNRAKKRIKKLKRQMEGKENDTKKGRKARSKKI